MMQCHASSHNVGSRSLPELSKREGNQLQRGCSRAAASSRRPVVAYAAASNGNSGSSRSSSRVRSAADGLFKNAATVSLASSDDEQSAAAAAAAAGAGLAAPSQLHLPKHWEEQIRTAPLGRRRVLQRYVSQVAVVNALEPLMRSLTDSQLAEQTLRFRDILARNTHRLQDALNELLPEAFATVREASRRVLGMRHFDSQLVGGMVLHEGQIAEMATGEGKTLVAVLAAYLNALPGTLTNPPTLLAAANSNSSSSSHVAHERLHVGGVHVVTVNDYLAARDAEWMGKVYSFLGLTVGAVQSNISVEAAQAAYSCHITYVTGQELCFTYLKDNTAQSAAELVLPDVLGFAVVDEVDSILIDESRNPMIISQPRSDNSTLVATVDGAVRKLWALVMRGVESAVARQPERPRAEVEAAVKARYLVLDTKQRSLSLSQEGMALLFALLAEQPGVVFRAAVREGRPATLMDLWEDDVPWGNMAITSLKAYQYYTCGVQYIVRDGQVVIVDESTGRVRPISRYSGGLHQAIEAKEDVEVKPDSHATASITFQVFFRFYQKLAGMTGTARSAAAEFYEIYGLRVVPIPTNKPPRRKDLPLRLYYTEQDKLAYVVSVVESCWADGRPVLIGTSSVNESEAVLQVLQEWCRPAFRAASKRVQLLNAKPENVRLEAQVVAQAGLPAAVTIATNMAGRGTDIILGGNPEGLTRMGLLRLVYRRLMPRLEACFVEPAAGGAEAQAATCELDALCPAMPLDVFEVYDVSSVSEIKARSPAEAASGLPRDLHLALLAAMMLSEVGGTALEGGNLSHDDLRQLASAALSAADVVRRTTLRRLRETYGHTKLQELDFTTVVAPKAEAVFQELCHTLQPYYMGHNAPLSATAAEDEEASSSGPAGAVAAAALQRLGPALEQLQQFGAKAALFLWLWFDQQCEAMAEQVVAAGGLLVLGTSLQEGERIELQLRGRAGRQGDPGTTQLMFDVGDPLISNFGMQTFQQLAGSLLSSGQLLPYQESVVVDLLHREVQKSMENQWQMARLETKRYDEVLEVYRRNLYSLRRLILTGDSQQRNRVMHMFIQQWVDQLVASLIDAAAGPAAWTRETLSAAEALAVPAAAGMATQQYGRPASPNSRRSSSSIGSGSLGSSSSEAARQQQQQQQQQRISPLSALMWHIHRLVNPPELVNKMQVEFKTVADGIAYDTTAQTVLQLTQAAAASGNGSSQQQQQQPRVATVPINVAEVTVLGPEQVQQLAAYLVEGAALPWPVPQFQVGFKTQLALAAHAKLFGTPAAAAYSSSHTTTSSSSSSSEPLQLPEHWSLPEGLLAMQRPPVKGRHAAKVQVLRNYLGTSLIHAYELRHLTLRQLLVSSSAGAAGSSSGMLDLDAELYLQAYCRSVMLEWVDALWSCFLEDVDKLRHAVGLKAYSSQQPLEEFRLEANRAFLVLLDSYRDAVVARLMVPDLNFSLLLDQQLDSLGEGDLPGSMQQPGTAAGVNGAVNGRGAGSNGRQPQGGDMLQPAGAANQRRMA
uniref:chloroplast protein-transporting ATPase n=1 Tax=Tetradesmus obliquus TaxID=3088 RepID=A0A383VIS3_TETOB|eukprot:jgi/Sobl393_1/1220/SZX65427.1